MGYGTKIGSHYITMRVGRVMVILGIIINSISRSYKE